MAKDKGNENQNQGENQNENPPTQPAKEKKPGDIVNFQTSVSWSGGEGIDGEGKIISAAFSYVPGQTVQLVREIADARQAAGLGRIVGE